ncbi:MAG: hypothetical protein HC853_11505 [Anaerolineae bacterium]|nr:hypothetical protein [Anaerolineae bacterium]
MVKQARKLAQQNQLGQAVALYQGVIEAVIEHEDEAMSDEEGELYSVVGDCAGGLGEALAHISAPDLRKRCLDVLLDIYLADLDMGGVGLGDDVPDLIAEHAKPDEKKAIIKKLRAKVSGTAGSNFSNQWRAQSIGSFILELEGDDLDDEQYLRICRQTGRWDDLVERLLSLKRLDEAVAETRKREDYELLKLSDVFVRYKQADVAEQLVLERAPKSKDSRLAEWLRERAIQKKDWAAALKWSKQLFAPYPQFKEYKEIKRYAEKLGRWPEERAQIIAALEKAGNLDFLIQCYLEEKQVDVAIETLRRKKQTQSTIYGYGFYGNPWAIEVAKAAEADYPGEALDIYRAEAEALIVSRSRSYYAQACEYLLRVQALSKRLKQDTAWQVYLVNLIENNKQLRALKDEMKKAGLT